MAYSPTWNNANAQGRLDPAEHWARLSDAEEIADAINRRRLTVYQGAQDFSSQVAAGEFVRRATLAAATAPPFDNFRDSLSETILSPVTGVLAGEPPTPTAMDWLWPIADADENKTIVSGSSGVGAGEVGLFQKLNGTTNWTDPAVTAGQTHVRAVHFNELRRTVEWLRRGRWELPIYFATGIFSIMPDSPWVGDIIANNGVDEVRSLGFAVLRTDDTPAKGLTNLTVRPAGYFELTADADCTVEIYRCLRPIEFVADPPTWNEYDPSASAAWDTPGGTGAGDATLIGSLVLTANVPGQLSNAALTAALQAMADGAEQNFLVRRSDTGTNTVSIDGSLRVEFDLDTPPN